MDADMTRRRFIASVGIGTVGVALGGLPAIAQGADSTAGPVASWDVADVVGEVLTDSSGHGHDLKLVGTTTEEFMGRDFLRFGADSCAEGSALGDGWDALTLTAIVFQESDAGAYGGIICRDMYGGPTGDAFGILTDPRGNWTGRLMTTHGQATVSAPMQTGWHMLTLAYDGETARLYVDGELAQEEPLEGALASQPNTPLTLGAYSNHSGGYPGGIACASIHDRALTNKELAAAWTAWQQAHPTAKSFTFAEASDTHITDTVSVEIVNDGVDMINADARVAFSLWLGDLTQYSKSDEISLARMTLDRLRRPHHALRGNHDLKADYYPREFGKLNYTFEHAGWKFIMLDSNPGDKTPIDTERMAWLGETLADTATDQPLVLCTHHPLYPNTKSYLLAESAELIGLFAKHNLKAALAGHYHGNQEEIIDGVLYATTSCLATTRGNFDGTTMRGYRLLHCTEDTITTEFVGVSDVP